VTGGYLLDTNIAIIAAAAPEMLSPVVRNALKKGPNILSVIAFWEVMLKSTKGKLDVGDPLEWWENSLNDLAATSLPLRPAHVAAIRGSIRYTRIRLTGHSSPSRWRRGLRF
jgi:PIN domain nuclease of toxin-antitoxin system